MPTEEKPVVLPPLRNDREYTGKSRVYKNKDGTTRSVLETRARDPKPCKGCGSEPRLPGSSRGQVCKDNYHTTKNAQKLTDDRLARKIAEQTGKPV